MAGSRFVVLFGAERPPIALIMTSVLTLLYSFFSGSKAPVLYLRGFTSGA